MQASTSAAAGTSRPTATLHAPTAPSFLAGPALSGWLAGWLARTTTTYLACAARCCALHCTALGCPQAAALRRCQSNVLMLALAWLLWTPDPGPSAEPWLAAGCQGGARARDMGGALRGAVPARRASHGVGPGSRTLIPEARISRAASERAAVLFFFLFFSFLIPFFFSPVGLSPFFFSPVGLSSRESETMEHGSLYSVGA